jgi:hypothetical protein
MKTIRQSISCFFIMLLASACAGALATIPEKYNLDNQLENVTTMSRVDFKSWERIDNQSFILQTGTSDYYLVVLESEANSLPSINSIQISNDDYLFWPGYSTVTLNDDGWEDSYIINRVYKFKDCSQVEVVKAQLRTEGK